MLAACALEAESQKLTSLAEAKGCAHTSVIVGRYKKDFIKDKFIRRDVGEHIPHDLMTPQGEVLGWVPWLEFQERGVLSLPPKSPL